MYRTNGLWYAQVGNSQTQIDTTELPSIRSVEYAASTPVPPPSLRDQLAGDNTNVINMVLQDTGPLLSHGTPVKNTTPQIHSNTAWNESPPLLQRSDTCSESDSKSEDSDNILTQNINALPTPPIPITITTKQQVSKPGTPKQSNCNKRYYIHGRRYKHNSTELQRNFQRMINDTLDVFQQCHQVPAVARPCILNKGTSARVQTVGRYLPKPDLFKWQQKKYKRPNRSIRIILVYTNISQ